MLLLLFWTGLSALSSWISSHSDLPHATNANYSAIYVDLPPNPTIYAWVFQVVPSIQSFPTKFLTCISRLPETCHIARPPNPPRSDHPSDILCQSRVSSSAFIYLHILLCYVLQKVLHYLNTFIGTSIITNYTATCIDQKVVIFR